MQSVLLSGPVAGGQLRRTTRRAEHIVGEHCCPRRVDDQVELHTTDFRYKLVAGAPCGRFETPFPDGLQRTMPSHQAQKLSHHICANLLVSTEVGAKTHSIIDHTPWRNRLGAWRRLINRFGPAPAQSGLNLMGRILKPSHS